VAGAGSENDPPWALIGVLLALALIGGGVYVAAQNRKRESYEAEEA
jgi:hypothetical protein